PCLRRRPWRDVRRDRSGVDGVKKRAIVRNRILTLCVLGLVGAGRVLGDPILQSSYIGGADPDSANAVATDPATGDVIVAGQSYSNEGHGVDGFVARFDPTLKTLLRFAYVGG